MNGGDTAHAGNVTGQARVQRLDLHRRIVEAGELPPLRPSLDLALHESRGTAQIPQVARHGIQAMEVGHGVDEGEGDPAAHFWVRLHAGGDGRAHHLAVPSLHDEEVRAEHAEVVAEDVGARSTIELAPESGKHLELASHVVCARGDLTHGWPAQHELVRAEADQVCQVRRAIGELENLDGLSYVLEDLGQPRAEPGVKDPSVQLLSTAYGRRLGRIWDLIGIRCR